MTKSSSISVRVGIDCRSSTPVSKGFDWNALIPALLAATLVIVGWIIVERFARRRETRSDLRAAVVNFASAVDEVTTAAVAFFVLSGVDHRASSLAASIKSKISMLSDYMHTLQDAGLRFEADDLLKQFRQSATGGDFESAARQPLASNSPALTKIANDAQSV